MVNNLSPISKLELETKMIPFQIFQNWSSTVKLEV